jgi:hypothetical protein
MLVQMFYVPMDMNRGIEYFCLGLLAMAKHHSLNPSLKL